MWIAISLMPDAYVFCLCLISTQLAGSPYSSPLSECSWQSAYRHLKASDTSSLRPQSAYRLFLMTYVLWLTVRLMPDAFVHAIPDAFVVCRPGKLLRRSLPVGCLLRTVVRLDSNKHIAYVHVLWRMPLPYV